MTRRLAALALVGLLAGCQPSGRASAPGSVPAQESGGELSAAGDVLRRYYAAIEARDYPSAYALWSQGGQASGQTYDQFASGFTGTAHTQLEFTGPVTLDGAAAGSIFATAPVRVRATTTAGERQEFVGTYVLRRVNDIPGATPEQLRWHIHGAKLEPVR